MGDSRREGSLPIISSSNSQTRKIKRQLRKAKSRRRPRKRPRESSEPTKKRRPSRVSPYNTRLHGSSIDEFKTYRKVMFALGKTIKYTLWVSFALFWYHMYLLKKTEKPESGFLANQVFLALAKSIDADFYDLKLLLTRPPVEKLLPDRPPLPPGAAYPKTLVLNLRGTLVHSEYKVRERQSACLVVVVVERGHSYLNIILDEEEDITLTFNIGDSSAWVSRS